MADIPPANLPPSYLEKVTSGAPPVTSDKNFEKIDLNPQLQAQPQGQFHPEPQPYPKLLPEPQPPPYTQPQPQQQVRLQVQPQAQVVPTYVVTTQAQTHGVMFCGNLGEHPCPTTCPNCHQNIITRVIYKPGAFSWLMCFVFVIVGLFCGCCLIPFFMDSFQDAHHSCPLCHAHLHVHKRM